MKQITNARDAYIALGHDGGFSWHIGGSTPTHGYMVAIPGHEWKMPANLPQIIIEARIKSMFDSAAANASAVGGWLDENQLYLDYSIHVGNRHAAIELGKRYNQLAIFEIHTGKCIDTGR